MILEKQVDQNIISLERSLIFSSIINLIFDVSMMFIITNAVTYVWRLYTGC